jgi:hypothetical protein
MFRDHRYQSYEPQRTQRAQWRGGDTDDRDGTDFHGCDDLLEENIETAANAENAAERRGHG